jgi:ATP adenylyltransferase
MHGCQLCVSERGTTQVEAWNKPIFETQHFVAVPSLGALLPGWMLISPKQHYICTGAIPESLIPELLQFKSDVSQCISRLFGEVVLFEHGPSAPSCDVGCGVDHAHLHVVPIVTDLISAVTSFLPENLEWIPGDLIGCRRAYMERLSYLYVEKAGQGNIATHADFGSQLFRRAIARELNRIDEYNWRDFPQYKNVLATIEIIHNEAGGHHSCPMPIPIAA